MNINILTEQHLEFIGLKGSFIGSSESIHVKMPHCWKLHVAAHMLLLTLEVPNTTKVVWFCRLLKCFRNILTNSANPNQCPRCLTLF